MLLVYPCLWSLIWQWRQKSRWLLVSDWEVTSCLLTKLISFSSLLQEVEHHATVCPGLAALQGSVHATLSGWLRHCCIFLSQWYAEVEELAPTLSQVGLAWHYCKDHPKRRKIFSFWISPCHFIRLTQALLYFLSHWYAEICENTI